MHSDTIAEIGITAAGSVFVRPATADFPHVHVEAMCVGWDAAMRRLVSPVPFGWSHADWFREILAAARQQGTCLRIEVETRWTNVDSAMRREFERIALAVR